MKINYVINGILILLCIGAIIINTFFQEYKIVGLLCIIAIGLLGIFKEQFQKNRN